MIELSLSGPRLEDLAKHLSQHPDFAATSPKLLEYGYHKQKITPDWSERFRGATKVLEAKWQSGQRLACYPGLTVEATVPLNPDPTEILAWLSDLDFELASFQTLRREWQAIDPDYIPPGFTNRHRLHGPFAAFKGAGHQRLVSEHWLKYAPIKLITHGPISFAQFHDVQADAATSLRQAKPGHLALSSEATGGFIQLGYLLENEFKGVLDESRQVLKIAVLGRVVSPREMLDAAALRGMVKGKEIKNVGFVFLDENAVGAQLHELWLRGLECWTIRNGREVRLDESYIPSVPIPPTWVR